jgi:hypothetical protein
VNDRKQKENKMILEYKKKPFKFVFLAFSPLIKLVLFINWHLRFQPEPAPPHACAQYTSGEG